MQGSRTPLTDLRRRVNLTRRLILDLLTERLGPVDLRYEFYREWIGWSRYVVRFAPAHRAHLAP